MRRFGFKGRILDKLREVFERFIDEIWTRILGDSREGYSVMKWIIVYLVYFGLLEKFFFLEFLNRRND